MVLLVDAYNVLKRGAARQQITQGQREAFIARLAAYAAKRNHEIIAVFDGGDSSYPINERQQSVRVIFSGDRMTADDVLKQLCEQYAQRETALVSSDRQLCAYASLYGVTCIDAPLLFEVLDTAAAEVTSIDLTQKNGLAQKRPGYESTAEVDALMEQASEQVVIKSEDEYAAKRKRAAQKLSKIERKLGKIVKKL